RHTRWPRDWSSDVCSSDLFLPNGDTVRKAQKWFRRLSCCTALALGVQLCAWDVAAAPAKVGVRTPARPAAAAAKARARPARGPRDRKSTRLNSSHVAISYA